MKTTQLWSALALGAALTLSGVAQAQTEGQVQGEVEQTETGMAKRESVTLGGSASGFGTPGQIVLSQDFVAGIGYRTEGPNQFFLNIQPAADYFLMQNISVGAVAGFGLGIGEGDDTFDLSLGARAGFAMPLAENISLWPRLQLGFVRNQVSAVGGSVSNTDFQLGVSAPALVHLNNGFFLGLGPDIRFIPGDGKGVTAQVTTLVGGYF